jgi:hypothetical protein
LGIGHRLLPRRLSIWRFGRLTGLTRDQARCLRWVKGVILTVHRSLPVFPTSGHSQCRSLCLKRANRRRCTLALVSKRPPTEAASTKGNKPDEHLLEGCPVEVRMARSWSPTDLPPKRWTGLSCF